MRQDKFMKTFDDTGMKNFRRPVQKNTTIHIQLENIPKPLTSGKHILSTAEPHYWGGNYALISLT